MKTVSADSSMAYSVRDWDVTGDDLERLTGGFGCIQQCDQHRRDILARDASATRGVGDRHPTGPRVVGQQARPHDRRVQCGAGPDVFVRVD
jgi:hypothetical protein